MLRLLHNSICWLLSAVMLLTNGWPVAVQHAHDVGDDPYHHSHQLPAALESTDIAAAVGDAEALVAVTEHVHLLWLGWEVTILPPKGGQRSPSPSVLAVGMPATLVETTASDNGSVTLAEYAPFSAALVASVEAGPSTGLSESSVGLAALPLCDSARHLRSGVQLI